MRFLAHLILLTLFLTGFAPGQSATLPRDVFVLVDVSGSMVGDSYGIGYSKVAQARDLVRDLLTDTFQWADHPQWQVSLLSPEIQAVTSNQPGHSPLLQPGSRLFLKRFGDPATSKAPSREVSISQVTTDVDRLFSFFPAAGDFDDQRTFLWLARAVTRQEAMARNLTSYLLVEITDAREDKENIVDADDQVAVREFKSLKHVPVNGEIGAFTHRNTQGEYVLQVNVRLVRLAGDPGDTAAAGSTVLANLKVPQNLAPGQDARISWDSFNAPGGISYTVTLEPPSGSSRTLTVSTPSATFDSLDAGDHAVTVSTPDGATLGGRFSVTASAPSAPTLNPSPTSDLPSEIVLQSPRPDAELTAGSVTVSWRVVNPPPDAKYLVTLSGPPGAPRIPKKTVDGTRASFSLSKAGPYRLRVASTALEVKPATITFFIKNEAGKKLLSLLLILLPIAILAIVGIRHARKRRHGEDEFDRYTEDLD